MGADEGIKGGFSDRLLLSTPFHKWSPLYWRLPAAKNSDSTHITSSKLSSHLPYTTLCEFEHESATFRNSSFKRCDNQNSFDWSNFHLISIPSKVLQICVLCILWPLPADLSTIQIWAPQQTWLISRRLSPRIRRRAWSIYTHSYHSQYYLQIPNDPTDDCNTDIMDDVRAMSIFIWLLQIEEKSCCDRPAWRRFASQSVWDEILRRKFETKSQTAPRFDQKSLPVPKEA